MATLNDLGCDIDSQWTFNEKNDLLLTDGEDNLIQAINNRLNTFYDRLDLMYDDYGSFLHSYLGWKANDETLEFMKLEVETTLEQDPRIVEPVIEVNYTEEGEVIITLDMQLTEDDELEMNLLLDDEGVTTLDEDVEVETDAD